MIIMGINAFEEKPSACLLVDGKLKRFCEEDKFTRLKGSYGHFPINATRWCLRSEGVSLKAVDRIAVSWGCDKYPYRMLGRLAGIKLVSMFGGHRTAGSDNGLFDGFGYLYTHSPGNMRRKIRDSLRMGGFTEPVPEIVFVEHHLSHAYQAFFQSPFENASVLVADGSGEDKCVSGFHFCSGQCKKIFAVDIPFSLGWFFAGFTAYLGFRPNMDEGKLMGLAAYGEERKNNNAWIERFERIIRRSESGCEVDADFFKFGRKSFHPKFTDRLANYIMSFDKNLPPLGMHNHDIHLKTDYVDIAYAVQYHLESVVQRLARRLVDATGCGNLCCSGGIFMNCKLNGSLHDTAGIENLFVHPASSDDGASIGAALYVSDGSGQSPRNPLQNVQYGPRYGNDEVEEILKTCHISYTKPTDIGREVAKIISRQQTAGWFHGGVEMGARALGGRSILAYPGNPKIKDALNARIKFREMWRPYCPSLPKENRAAYFEKPIETPFMVVARSATAAMKKKAPSVVHVDGSTRPQTVDKKILPQWHHMIESLTDFGLDPIVLNTSFNIRGEPIVCSPYDAIRTFFASGLDALAMEDCLIIKQSRGE
jgi:carbamoyltransferase